MANNPCKDCVFFKLDKNRITERMLMNTEADLKTLREKVEAHKALPWWKFWKLHPDSKGHHEYYLERLVEKLRENTRGSCTLNPVHIRVSEDHGCGQHKPKA